MRPSHAKQRLFSLGTVNYYAKILIRLTLGILILALFRNTKCKIFINWKQTLHFMVYGFIYVSQLLKESIQRVDSLTNNTSLLSGNMGLLFPILRTVHALVPRNSQCIMCVPLLELAVWAAIAPFLRPWVAGAEWWSQPGLDFSWKSRVAQSCLKHQRSSAVPYVCNLSICSKVLMAEIAYSKCFYSILINYDADYVLDSHIL